MNLTSERLSYRPIDADDRQVLYDLLTDAYVRRYLMDGKVESQDWMAARIEDSIALFGARGVGLWLVGERDKPDAPPFGLAGFHVADTFGPDEPELLYALYEPFAGQGYGTEMGRTLIDLALGKRGFARIVTGVDAPNLASQAVLRKLAFTRIGTTLGAFGEIYLYEHRPAA